MSKGKMTIPFNLPGIILLTNMMVHTSCHECFVLGDEEKSFGCFVTDFCFFNCSGAKLFSLAAVLLLDVKKQKFSYKN